MSYNHTKSAVALTFVATVRPRRSFEFANGVFPSDLFRCH
jgi:hypothetical protein